MRGSLKLRFLALLAAPLLLPACAATAPGSAASDPEATTPTAITASGTASYIAASLAGRRTASGAPFDPEEMVAAHRTLPFGTRLRVTNVENGRAAIVTVVDRGPFRKTRLLDVSPRCARELGFYRRGLARVRVEVLETPDVAEAEPR